MTYLLRKYWFFIIVITVILFSGNILYADVRLPSIFWDNMVLQQDKPIRVWGWADAAEEVSVQINELSATTTADFSGVWYVSLDSMTAGGPYTMTVAGEDTITLSNILVGEVWLASGQFNMEMALKQGVPGEWNTGVTNWENEITEADYPDIRLFRIPRRTAGMPLNDVAASWKICSPSTVGDISAVAYFFGKEIHNRLEVPVGIIQSAWGGSRIEPWTPPVGFEENQSFEDIRQRISEANEQYRVEVKARIDTIEVWVNQSKTAIEEGSEIPLPPEFPVHPLDGFSEPTSMYNGMIYPIVPFSIQGAIWYQGESNRMDGLTYLDKMRALIGSWRTIWDLGDFPFYYVQLAPYRYGDDDPLHLARVREAQRLALNIPNTGMAVTMDIGDLSDIHPVNKQDVGHRLALWAFAQTYGYENIIYSGPLFRNTVKKGRNIIVYFDNVTGRLATIDGNPPSWFEIAGKDGKFIPARTEIEGRTVRVWNQNVYKPVYVRYGWHQEALPNLINARGLPASPFNSMHE